MHGVRITLLTEGLHQRGVDPIGAAWRQKQLHKSAHQQRSCKLALSGDRLALSAISCHRMPFQSGKLALSPCPTHNSPALERIDPWSELPASNLLITCCASPGFLGPESYFCKPNPEGKEMLCSKICELDRPPVHAIWKDS